MEPPGAPTAPGVPIDIGMFHQIKAHCFEVFFFFEQLLTVVPTIPAMFNPNRSLAPLLTAVLFQLLHFYLIFFIGFNCPLPVIH
jgi:hypothetical protein